MHIHFTEKDPKKILSSLQSIMAERELGKIVSFDWESDKLVVTISKLGKSTLTFLQKASTQGLELKLDSERIALAHRAFKEEVTDKIKRVIEKAGGVIKA